MSYYGSGWLHAPYVSRPAALRLVYRPVARQPGGGGSELGWVEHQAHPPPPLGHCPRDVINLKNAPTLGHSQAPPPLDIVRVTSSALRKIGKHPPLGHSQAPPLGHCPCDVIHIPRVEQNLWDGQLGGGRTTPPRPPPGYGPEACLTKYR